MSTTVTTTEKAKRLRHILIALAEQPLLDAADYRRAVYLQFITDNFSAWLGDNANASVTHSVINHLHFLLVRELELFLAGDAAFSQGRLFLILTAQRGERATLVKQQQQQLRPNVVQFQRALVSQ